MIRPNDRRDVAEAVLTAVLCAFVTKIAEWVADEVRDRFGRAKDAEGESKE